MSAKKLDQDKPPVVQGFMHYFPRAIKAVSLASKAGTEKYKLTYADKNFMDLDPARLHDADGRHILDEAIDGMYDPETKLIHAALHAWEAMARLEVLLESGMSVYGPVPPKTPPEKGSDAACSVDIGLEVDHCKVLTVNDEAKIIVIGSIPAGAVVTNELLHDMINDFYQDDDKRLFLSFPGHKD